MRRRGVRTPAGRRAGALVVLLGGVLALYVERGGRTILPYVDDEGALAAAAKALAEAMHAGALGSCPSSAPTHIPDLVGAGRSGCSVATWCARG